MTKLIADEDCTACGGLLIPPMLATGAAILAGADYVCMECGRPYHWVGNPPKLVPFSAADQRDDDNDDNDAP